MPCHSGVILEIEKGVRLLLLIIVLTAFAFLEVFIGGARLLYLLPGISLIAIASLGSIYPKLKTSNRCDLPALLSCVVFTVYILIRNRFSDIEYLARFHFFTLAGCFLIYLLFSLVLTKPIDRSRLFYFLMLLALLEMVPALIQFSQGKQWMPLSWAQRRDTMWRASGFFIYPNNLAGFLEVIGLMAASFTIWGKGKVPHKVLTAYIALVCVVGVALSGSRGGYLSLFFGSVCVCLLSLVAWSSLKNKNFPLVMGLSAGILACLFVGVMTLIYQSHEIAERVMQINDPENVRFLLWEAAIKQFQRSPFWGTGGDSYLYFGRLFRNPVVQSDPIHAHNDYLQLLADYGIVGISLFSVFLLLHIRAGIRSFGKLISSDSVVLNYQSDRLALCIGSFAGLAAYIVHSIVDFNMQMPLNAFMMAAILSVVANPGSPQEERRNDLPGQRIRVLFRWVLPAFGAAVLIYALPMIPGEYFAESSRVALRDKDPTRSLEQAKKGITFTTSNPELYFYLGEAAMQLAALNQVNDSQLQKEGLQAYAQALLLFRYDSRIALRLGMAHAANGDYSRAVESINYAERLDPNSSFIPAYRGMIEYHFNHLNDADTQFQRAIKMGGEGGNIGLQGEKLLQKSPVDPAVKQAAKDSQKNVPLPPPVSNTPKTESSRDSGESISDLLQGMPSMTTGHPVKKSDH